MKLKSLILIMLLLMPALIQAQSEQLQREIRIAEGILQELFQENLRDDSPFIAFRNNRVTSDYIPGYGVHFILGRSLWTGNLNPARINEIRIVQSTENRTSRVAIRNDGQNQDNEADQVSIEELEKRMTEYFTQYASLLRHLPDNEYIRLSTGLRSPAGGIVISLDPLDQGTRNFDFPKITKWVNKSTVMEFERGVINENQFIQQIQTADLSEMAERRDFTIFKSILDTSVREAKFEHLRVRSSSDYTYLPGFGIQFNVNAGTRGILPFNVTFTPDSFTPSNRSNAERSASITIERERVEQHREELEREIDSIRRETGKTLDSLRLAIEDVTVSLREAFAVDLEQPDPELLEKEKKLLYDEITRALRDYGTTLSSLSNEEFIIVSVNWSARGSELPERTYFRISKRDLISGREPAVEEIFRK